MHPGYIGHRLGRTSRNMALVALAVATVLGGYLVAMRVAPDAMPVLIWWPFEIAAWLIVVVAAFVSVSSWRTYRDPSQHPTVERLAKLGDAAQQIAQLESELASDDKERWGDVVFTRSFLFEDLGLGLEIIPIDAIVWAYREVTEHRKGGVITTHETHKVFVHLRTEEIHEIDCDASESDNIVLCIRQRSDSMLSGFDEALKQRWKSDPAQVIAAIDRLAAEGRLDEGIGALDDVIAGNMFDHARDAQARLSEAIASAERR